MQLVATIMADKERLTNMLFIMRRMLKGKIYHNQLFVVSLCKKLSERLHGLVPVIKGRYKISV